MRWHEELRCLGFEVLQHNSQLLDQRWWWARHIQLAAVVGYVEHQQRYKQETEGSVVAGMFSIDLVGTLFSSACEDVAMALGMQELLLKQKNREIRDQFGVDMWMDRVRQVYVKTEQMMSPLILLNGTHPGGLRIEEEVML